MALETPPAENYSFKGFFLTKVESKTLEDTHWLSTEGPLAASWASVMINEQSWPAIPLLAGLWGRRWSLVMVRVALAGWPLSGDASRMPPFISEPFELPCWASRSWPPAKCMKGKKTKVNKNIQSRCEELKCCSALWDKRKETWNYFQRFAQSFSPCTCLFFQPPPVSDKQFYQQNTLKAVSAGKESGAAESYLL